MGYRYTVTESPLQRGGDSIGWICGQCRNVDILIRRPADAPQQTTCFYRHRARFP